MSPPPPPPPPLRRVVYTGPLIDTHVIGQLRVREHAIVGVDERGCIAFLEELRCARVGGANGPERAETATGNENEEVRDEEEEEVKRIVRGWGWGGGGGWDWVRGRKGGWFFPGFVDTHIHAPQYPNVGLFGKSTLLDWLQKYTFPLEASFASQTKAKKVYTRCVARTLSHGTTTAAYYATTHVDSTNLLASICLDKGQRAFIGRCNMDSDLNPDYYRDASPESAIRDTKATIEHIKLIDPSFELVSPIITPRFAPSCSTALLASLGALAAETKLPVQTHIAENPSEVALVAKMFPSHESYAAVYRDYGLLTSRSILAHAIYLSNSECTMIRRCGSSVSHCPVSNSSISSGVCPVRELLDHSIQVGLGTDVSGGWSPSILVAVREAAMVSRIIATRDRDSRIQERGPQYDETTASDQQAHLDNLWERKKLSVEECLYLATAGGAQCLGLGHKVGRFDIGMEWDAQMIELEDFSSSDYGSDQHISDEDMGGTLTDHGRRHRRHPIGPHDREESGDEGHSRKEDRGPVELWGTEKWGEKVAKWAFCGDDRNTIQVWVKGRLVHER